MTILWYGLLTGVLFGFFLQRGQVLRYDKQLGALLLKDMTIVKFMLSHILVAMPAVYLLYDMGLVSFNHKPMLVGAVVIGGLLFGIGWGMLGYCPGTSVGALAEGRLDALWGIGGMLVGAALYAEAYPLLAKTVLTWGNYGKIALPQLIGVNHWLVIVPIMILGVGLFAYLEKRGL